MLAASLRRATVCSWRSVSAVTRVPLLLPAVPRSSHVAHSSTSLNGTVTATTTATATAASPEAVVTSTSEAAKQGEELLAKNEMLQPSVVNTSQVRTVAMLAAVALAAGSGGFLPVRLAAFLHISSYAVWLGANIWNTFFVGFTMFKNMPRQMFGKVQSVLFPKYFGLTTGCNVLVLGSLLTAPAVLAGPGGDPRNAALGLGVALACSLANAVVIEPKATTLMFQRYDIENKAVKTEEDKAEIAVLYKQFGKWHGISSMLNLIITCAAVAHGWHLAGCITGV